MAHLDNEVTHLLSSSIATSSSRTYNSGVQCYLQFCSTIAYQPFPVSEDLLLWFIASVRQRLGYKSIKVYLAGVQFYSTIAGHPIEWHKFSRVYHALRGIRKLQGNNFTRPPRSPITLRHLSKLLKHFNRHFLHPDNIMLSAAVLTAFFRLLRVSEYTSNGKRTFDPMCTLMFNDVRFQKKFRFVQIKIAQSKTDPFRAGCLLKVWATGSKFCPVLALRRFIEVHPFGKGPLFTSTIQVLGRWSSEAYKLYLRLPDSTFR